MLIMILLKYCKVIIADIKIDFYKNYSNHWQKEIFLATMTLKLMKFYDDFLILYILKLIFVIINKIIFKYI